MAKVIKQTARISDNQSVRVRKNPDSFDQETVCWQIRDADWDHPLWGWSQLTSQVWHNEIRQKFSDFETMTWFEIKSQTGGKRVGTNHHFIPIAELSKRAQDRLMVLSKDDLDGVFSLRLTATTRVYGYKDGRVFRMLWYDQYHGNPDRAVCPSVKRYT